MVNKVFRAALVAAVLGSHTVFASPARADLTAAQKQKLCSLLTLPSATFNFNFTVTRRNGFGLQQEDPKAAAKVRLTASEPGTDTSPLIRARFQFRRGLDYQELDQKDKAATSFASAETICRAAAPKSAGAEKARLLCLQAELQLVQLHRAEALALAKKAVQTAPTAWEAQEELGAIYTDAVTSTAKASYGKKGAEGLAALTQMDTDNNQASEAFQKAIALLEKSQPDVPKRDPQAYYSHIGSLFILPYYKSWTMAQRQAVKSGTAAGDTTFDYVSIFRSPDFQHSLKSVQTIDPSNPYGIGFAAMAQTLQKPVTATFSIPENVQTSAQAKLKPVYEAPDQSTPRRAQAYLTAGSLFAINRDMAKAVPLLAQGIALAPDNEVLQVGYAVCLTTSTPPRYDEAKAFLNKQIAATPTPTLRLLLAKVYETQEDLPHAQDVLETLLAADPKNVLAQIATAGIRLKQGAAAEAADLKPTGLLLQSIGRDNPGLSGAPWTSFVEATIVYYALVEQLDLAKNVSTTLLSRVPDDQVAKTLVSFAP